MNEKSRGMAVLSVRLVEAEAAAVAEAAEEAGLTRSEYIRACVRRGMDEAGDAVSDAIGLTGPTSSLVEVLWEIQQTCDVCYGLHSCLAEVFEEEGDMDSLARAEEIMRQLDAMQDVMLDTLEQALEVLREAKQALGER